MAEEEDVCKVCRSPGEVDDPLFHPCACKGSVRFVHQSCLQQWLKHSRSEKCEVRGSLDGPLNPFRHLLVDTPFLLPLAFSTLFVNK